MLRGVVLFGADLMLCRRPSVEGELLLLNKPGSSSSSGTRPDSFLRLERAGAAFKSVPVSGVSYASTSGSLALKCISGRSIASEICANIRLNAGLGNVCSVRYGGGWLRDPAAGLDRSTVSFSVKKSSRPQALSFIPHPRGNRKSAYNFCGWA